jgi:hypothetical protein
MPSLHAKAEERDLELVASVIKVLDLEFGTTFVYEGTDKLTYMVKYLWKVFGYSFYGAVRAEDERCLALKCFMYERAPSTDLPTTEALTFE